MGRKERSEVGAWGWSVWGSLDYSITEMKECQLKQNEKEYVVPWKPKNKRVAGERGSDSFCAFAS